MLILYVKDNCRYSTRALAALVGVTEPVEIRNKSLNAAYAEELMQLQNSAEVPYLIDTTKEIDVDESDAIVKYVRDHYGSTYSAPPINETSSCVAE